MTGSYVISSLSLLQVSNLDRKSEDLSPVLPAIVWLSYRSSTAVSAEKCCHLPCCQDHFELGICHTCWCIFLNEDRESCRKGCFFLNSDLQSAPFNAVFWQLMDIILSLKRDESIIHHFLCLLSYYKYDVAYRHHRHLFWFWKWENRHKLTFFIPKCSSSIWLCVPLNGEPLKWSHFKGWKNNTYNTNSLWSSLRGQVNIVVVVQYKTWDTVQGLLGLGALKAAERVSWKRLSENYKDYGIEESAYAKCSRK